MFVDSVRIRVAAAGFALAGVLAGCAGEGQPAGQGTAPPAATGTAGAGPSPPATAPAASPAGQVVAIRVRVADGKVSGVGTTVGVRQGQRVRIEVASDVTDEVHVHGYELLEPVAAGRTAAVEFTADLPGAFEVELEQRSLRLFELQVRP